MYVPYMNTFYLEYKHSGTFANHKYEELPYPKIRKCVTLVPLCMTLVPLLNMQPVVKM